MLSAALGLVLKQMEAELPRAGQEAMETIIGIVAVFFVTYMILWMNKNARFMKRELQGKSAAALSTAGTSSLAVMAFLAVLREGFETSVFLVAASSVIKSAVLPFIGAVIGRHISGSCCRWTSFSFRTFRARGRLSERRTTTSRFIKRLILCA